MTQVSFERYAGTAAENYERYFVPAIGAPLAADLIEAAGLQQGERVLDLACGTGVIARLAAEQIGEGGMVAGIDVNPGMLAVARRISPPTASMTWHAASADALPLPDGSVDVALCQMGLQFFPDRPAALREVRRVLAPDGRVVLNVPGPTPLIFSVLEEALGRQLSEDAANFVRVVFALHERDELRMLLDEAGFEQVDVSAYTKTLTFPPPRDFLWQYVFSTPLAGPVADLDEERRAAIEREVVEAWDAHLVEGALAVDIGTTVAVGRAP